MGLKIAVTSAFGWPYVRRGNRVAYELACYLSKQGHQVHFITTKPGKIRRKKNHGKVLMDYYPLIEHPLLTRFKIHYWQLFGFSCLCALLKEDFDIIHTTSTLDGFAASLNKSIKKTPFVPVIINGEPLYRDARRCRVLFSRIVKKASCLVSISHYVNGILKRDFGMEGIVIPCPVDTSKFSPSDKKKLDPPRILCTAALTQARKRIPLLVKAFEKLIDDMPNAILQLAGETNPEINRNLFTSVNAKTRRAIEFLDITSDEDLASVYRNASISVIPSLKEPFGMVTTESLASGTPVVGTRSGGTAEILDDPCVGVLFEPTDGPNELCDALIKGLKLAQDPQTSQRCSQYAEKYSWNHLGPHYEKLYPKILDGHSKRIQRHPKDIKEETISPNSTIRNLFFQHHPNRRLFNRIFDEILDEPDMTYDVYYEIDSYRPRCIAVLNWLTKNRIAEGAILVLSPYPHFLTIILKRLGFNAKGIILNQGSKAITKPGNHEILSDLQDLKFLQENFDVIICDDLLQYLASPIKTLQILNGCIKPKGALILSTINVARGELRLRLLTGRNIYPWLENHIGSLGENFQHPLFYREYTLKEVEELVSKAGFKVIKNRPLIGKKPIDNRITSEPRSVKIYFLKKIYYQVQKIFSPLRSHLFIVGEKITPKD